MNKKNFTKEMSKFQMPPNLIDQLYELSGNADKYKAIVLGYISEDGVPLIYAKYDSQVVEFGMRKALEKYLENADAGEIMFGGGNLDEDFLDEEGE
jgi:hypothetical protein